MQLDLTKALCALAAAIFAVISGFLIPWLRLRTTSGQRSALCLLVNTAVTAAQQLYQSDQGAEKKKYVTTWLKARGVSLDEDELDALVESAVYAMKNAASEVSR